MLLPNRPTSVTLRRFPLVCLFGAVACATACLREPLESRRTSTGDGRAPQSATVGARPPPGTPTREHAVLLVGTFHEVAKKASGSVTLERTGDTYELVVRNVALNDSGPVHVYFVGLPQVRSSIDLDGVDAKYDFGPIEETGSGAYVAEHRVKLPSEPKPELRSVALINPRFGVVLASSSLNEP